MDTTESDVHSPRRVIHDEDVDLISWVLSCSDLVSGVPFTLCIFRISSVLYYLKTSEGPTLSPVPLTEGDIVIHRSFDRFLSTFTDPITAAAISTATLADHISRRIHSRLAATSSSLHDW